MIYQPLLPESSNNDPFLKAFEDKSEEWQDCNGDRGR